MGGSTDINYPRQPTYGESLRESLGAQIDLAPQLFTAAKSEQYGEPAWAQLKTDVLRDTVLGAERFVPAAGQEEAYAAGPIPETRLATEAEMGVQTGPGPFSRDWSLEGEAPAESLVVAPPEGWDWVGGSREASDGMLQRTGEPPPMQMITEEGEAWRQYAESSGEPEVFASWRDAVRAQDPATIEQITQLGGDPGMSDNELAAFHYENFGKSQGIPAPPVFGETVQGKGLLSLMSGEGKRSYGTGGVIQGDPIFDPKTGLPQIDEFGEVITQTRPETEERRAGYSAGRIATEADVAAGAAKRVGDQMGDEFMGLAQYGSDVAEQAARRQRAADIRDVQQYGRMASEAIKAADPLSAQLIGTMGEQAQAELAAGGDLTTRERERATQDARMGWEARGRVRDPGAVVSELENLETARRAREAQRRGFATQTMQASRAMTADPFMAILGRPSGASQQIATGAVGGAGYGLGAVPSQYSPESGLSYALGQSTNLANLQAAQASADATRTAGMWAGLGALGGGLGGGLIARGG